MFFFTLTHSLTDCEWVVLCRWPAVVVVVRLFVVIVHRLSAYYFDVLFISCNLCYLLLSSAHILPRTMYSIVRGMRARCCNNRQISWNYQAAFVNPRFSTDHVLPMKIHNLRKYKGEKNARTAIEIRHIYV